MTALVVDASVALKWVMPETHSAAARRVLVPGSDLVVPDLLWPEVANALWKRVRAAELTAADAQELLRDLMRFPVVTLSSRPVLGLALQIATRFDRTVYDGVYLALAIARNCRLITADRRLYTSLRRTAISERLLWVEDEA